MILVECTCSGQRYCDGTQPEWYDDPDKAARRFAKWQKKMEEAGRNLYFGIHVGRLHVISLSGDYPSDHVDNSSSI